MDYDEDYGSSRAYKRDKKKQKKREMKVDGKSFVNTVTSLRLKKRREAEKDLD